MMLGKLSNILSLVLSPEKWGNNKYPGLMGFLCYKHRASLLSGTQ